MDIVYSCWNEVIVFNRMTTIPPPSTVSTVRARILGVNASKSCQPNLLTCLFTILPHNLVTVIYNVQIYVTFVKELDQN